MDRPNKQIDIAFDLVNNTNANIFLSGSAGTGKSTFIKKLMDTTCKQTVLVASSGVAAVNVGGVTIHSFFQLPYSPYIPGRTELKNYKIKESKRDVIQRMDLLIIDEISMVRVDILDAIDHVLRRERDSDSPFGGVQLLMVGDLFQLPPVTKRDVRDLFEGVYETGYFFGSYALKRSGFITIELTHIYRQDDYAFKNLLNNIRIGKNDTSVMHTLNSRCKIDFNPDDSKGYIRVMTHAASQADVYNEQRLKELDGDGQIYIADVTGEFPESNYPTKKELQLKIGARVMFIKNNSQKGIFNGMLGVLTSLSDKSVVIQPDGKDNTIFVEYEQWKDIEYVRNPQSGEIEEKVIGSFSQIPVRLAWAITIHKSQGLTFDKVILDLHRCFTHGQAYVALSRCRTIEGIVLSNYVGKRAIQCDETVKSFMADPEHAEPTENRIVELKKEFYMSYVRKLYDMQEICSTLERLVTDSNMKHISSTTHPGILKVTEYFVNHTANLVESFLISINNMVSSVLDYETNVQVSSLIKHNSKYLFTELEKVEKSLLALYVDEAASSVVDIWNKAKKVVRMKAELLLFFTEEGFCIEKIQMEPQSTTISFIESNSKESDSTEELQPSAKAYNVENIRRTHTQAYAKWTPEADAELGILYDQGMSIKQLMEHFGRNNGAIRSRLRKIGKL